MGGFRSPQNHLKRIMGSWSLQLCPVRTWLSQEWFSEVTTKREVQQRDNKCKEVGAKHLAEGGV